ncbi:MAG: DNA-binding protein WhiA [Clostridia bacterium]|nr:DNA-binding protein WhiA [Clostridia bacterium]
MTRDRREIGVKVRQELIDYPEEERFFPAYLSGVIRGLGELEFTLKGFALSFRHQDESFIDKISSVVGLLLGEKISYYKTYLDAGLTKGDYFVLNVPAESARSLLERCAIVKDRIEFVSDLPDDLFNNEEEGRRAYLRGLFLACGYLGLPEEINEWINVKTKGGYSLEFNLNSSIVADSIRTLIAGEAQLSESAVRIRPRVNVVYVRTAEAVEAILAAMGSTYGVLYLNEIMLERQVKNDLNRANNFDLANIDKSVRAIEKQVADVELILSTVGTSALNEGLRETCRLRLEYPDLGMEELGQKFSPPVGKSCVNHRLRKLAEIAADIRKRQ